MKGIGYIDNASFEGTLVQLGLRWEGQKLVATARDDTGMSGALEGKLSALSLEGGAPNLLAAGTPAAMPLGEPVTPATKTGRHGHDADTMPPTPRAPEKEQT